MRSAAAAIAWQLGRRHRWGLAGVALYLGLLGALRLVVGSSGRVAFDEGWKLALTLIVPMSAAFIYLIAVFTFGLDGDIASRRSMYPSRMFTLPVTTTALAGWPILYGTAAMAALWLATRALAVWPTGVHVPVVWPALFAAVVVAWAQALTWMPYAVRGMRIVATIALMLLIDVVVIPALVHQVSEAVMLGLLAPFLPAAVLVARIAVERARRGEAPDWRAGLGRALTTVRRSGRRRPFASSVRAQAWLEWRRYGRSLPILVAILLPFELSLLFAFREAPALVAATLVAALLTPPLLAVFVAPTVGRANPERGGEPGLSPFLATRPLTSATLLAAKLRATIRSTLAAWLLVLVAVPVALELSGTAPLVGDAVRRLVEAVGGPRATTLGMLGLAALVMATWSQLVQSLAIGMTGRPWLVKGSVFGALALLTVLVPFASSVVGSRAAIAAAWNALPWVLGTLVCFKTAAASWVALRLDERRLVRRRTLLVGAATWNVAVFGLYALLLWLVPTMLVPRHLLAFAAILAVPLVRLSAAPLALDWNRHR